jgi:hypothetical protein
MLDNLLDLVKQHAGDAIINNPAIPNEQNDEVISSATSSIVDGLKNAVSNGNIGDITSLFSGGSVANSSILQNIQGGFVGDLMNKFGVDPSTATNIAGNLIPNVLQKFVNKTNDPNDSSFDLQGILSHVGGGSLDVQSLISKFTGGQESGGGIMDTLKGFGLFGK